MIETDTTPYNSILSVVLSLAISLSSPLSTYLPTIKYFISKIILVRTYNLVWIVDMLCIYFLFMRAVSQPAVIAK